MIKKHINKFLSVLCVFAIISCEKKEPELPQLSQPATAAEFFQYNYWIIGAGFNYAETYIRKNNERLRATNDSCAIEIANKLEKELSESREALAVSQQNVIKVITQNIPEEHLIPANEYYKTTNIGRYIASEAGTAEMGRALLASPHKAAIAESLDNGSLSTDEKTEIVVGYMLKMLPSTETLSYSAFRNLPIWKELEAIMPKLREAMGPYTDNSQDIATLSNELKNCPSMIPKVLGGTAPSAAEAASASAAQPAPAAPAQTSTAQ